MSLLPSRAPRPMPTMAVRYPHPQYPPPGYSFSLSADQVQFGSPSSVSPVTSPLNEDYELVIHEHHHHHHHNTEEDESEHQQNGDDALPKTEELMDNIVNDKVLYDFVSFLLESQSPQAPVSVLPEERFSDEPLPPLYREETERIVSADLDDIEHFLEDGFEPIIEVELE